jgi:hypothetical protein
MLNIADTFYKVFIEFIQPIKLYLQSLSHFLPDLAVVSHLLTWESSDSGKMLSYYINELKCAMDLLMDHVHSDE